MSNRGCKFQHLHAVTKISCVAWSQLFQLQHACMKAQSTAEMDDTNEQEQPQADSLDYQENGDLLQDGVQPQKKQKRKQV